VGNSYGPEPSNWSRRPRSRLRAAYSGTLQVCKHRAARACQEAVATGLPQSVRPIQRARALKLLSMMACAPRNSASRQGTLFGGATSPPSFFPSHVLLTGPFSRVARFTAYRLPRIWSSLPSTHRALRHRKSASLTIELRLRLVSCSFIDVRINLERRQGRSGLTSAALAIM